MIRICEQVISSLGSAVSHSCSASTARCSLSKGVILPWLHQLVLTGFLVCSAHFILVSPPSRMARSLYEWLWQHEFWLPPGITWEDMQESEDTHYPQPRELLLSIPFALILVVIRCAFER